MRDPNLQSRVTTTGSEQTEKNGLSASTMSSFEPGAEIFYGDRSTSGNQPPMTIEDF